VRTIPITFRERKKAFSKYEQNEFLFFANLGGFWEWRCYIGNNGPEIKRSRKWGDGKWHV